MNSTERHSLTPAEARVLVIEDSVDNHATILRLLAFAGVAPRLCVCKYSGRGVIQYAASLERPVDLVLLDLMLPGEDGYEVLDQLRDLEEFSCTRIVAVTGKATIEEMRRAQAAGFDGFLGKPLDLERFPEQLARILKGEPVWEYR